MILPKDTIQRLIDVPQDDYQEALAILFNVYVKFPRMNVEFGHERAVLVEVINDTPQARRLIKSNNIKYEKYLNDTLKPSLLRSTNISGKAKHPTVQPAIPVTELEIGQLFKQEFVLTTHSIKDLLIAHMLTTALEKYEQQGASFLNPQGYELLSDHNLKIIELWEQASICPGLISNELFQRIHYVNLNV